MGIIQSTLSNHSEVRKNNIIPAYRVHSKLKEQNSRTFQRLSRT